MDPARWQRIAHLYQSALDRDPRERSAFLAQASAGDDELRREVESLLAQGSAPLLIDQPMRDLAAAMLAPPADLPPGRHWSVSRRAPDRGGGMGQVYRATDTRSIGRWLSRCCRGRSPANPLPDPLRREAQAIAALTHPHICTLYDVGHYPATEGGQAVDFLVMEYLEGRSLAARLEKDRCRSIRP